MKRKTYRFNIKCASHREYAEVIYDEIFTDELRSLITTSAFEYKDHRRRGMGYERLFRVRLDGYNYFTFAGHLGMMCDSHKNYNLTPSMIYINYYNCRERNTKINKLSQIPDEIKRLRLEKFITD